MRKLVYVLENGTIETSMTAAKESGMAYRVEVQEIHEGLTYNLLLKQAERRIKL